MKKVISIVIPCYNEEHNVRNLYKAIREIFIKLNGYSYECIFIDNASTDKTVAILKDIASNDYNVKLIVNARNFGPVRSPYYGLLQSSGDATILMAADFQEPPALIPELIKKWEKGYKIVSATKTKSEESFVVFQLRKLYYSCLDKLSEVKLTKNNTGFGLYDKKIIEILRGLNETYPYFRGLVCELGFESAKIEYVQPTREKGKSKAKPYSLYDQAMLGLTSHSKIPLRLAAVMGFLASMLSLFVALVYLIYKLLFWDLFSLGIAPIVIGIFFFSSVQLFFLGILGEYIGWIHTYILKRPLVIEKERVNFH